VTTSAVGDQNGGDVGIDVSSKTGVQTDISKNSSIMLKKLAMNVENTANDIRNILKGLSDKTRADTAQEREVNERNVIDQEMDRALNELERALQQQQLQSDGPTAAGDGGLLPGGKRSQRRSVLKQ
jgi:SMC interacting uncharacterized protein involved in chromosome segregation